MRALYAAVCFGALGHLSLAVSTDRLSDKAALRRQYRSLYLEKVKTISATESRFHRGALFRFSGLNVLSVEGDLFEMAFQHGKLLQKEVSEGSAVAASEMVSNQIDNIYGHRPVFANIAKAYIDKNFNDELLSNAARDYPARTQSALQQLFALSESSGVSLRTFIDGALNPSVLMILANGTNVKGEKLTLAPFSGCTSFAAWDKYTPDGKWVIGRNTDYPLTGAFERHATVIYSKPERGLKHVAIITAGVHSASVAAINESGVFLATHSLPSLFTGKTGVAPIMWLNDVLAESASVTEVVSKLTTLKFDVGWTFVIASEKEKRILSLEVDNSGFGIRESTSGVHVQTNHYLSAPLKSHTLFFNGGTKDETVSRFERATTLLEALKGKLGISEAVSILADREDPQTGLWSGYPNAIAAPTTATSLIYRPSTKELYVATGYAPVSGNPYVRLPLPEDFEVNRFSGWQRSTLENSQFQKSFPNLEVSVKAVIEAKQAFEYENNGSEALRLVSFAAAQSPQVARYQVLEGMFQIRSGDFTAAKATLTKALRGTLSPSGQAVAWFYLGRIAAHEGQFTEAATYLQLALDASPDDPKIDSAANAVLQKVASGRRHPLRFFEVIPQIQFGDSQSY